MKLRIIEVTSGDDAGVHVQVLSEGTSRTIKGTHVAMADIEAICEITVNGRDIEDGLAPLEIIGRMIEKRLDLPTEYVPMPTELPEWIATPQEAGWDVVKELEITALMAGLANLVMFGGEKEEVRLG